MAEKRKLSTDAEKKIFTTIGLLGFLGALICLSPNMTGKVIGELNTGSSNLLGIILLVIGVISIAIARIRD